MMQHYEGFLFGVHGLFDYTAFKDFLLSGGFDGQDVGFLVSELGASDLPGFVLGVSLHVHRAFHDAAPPSVSYFPVHGLLLAFTVFTIDVPIPGRAPSGGLELVEWHDEPGSGRDTVMHVEHVELHVVGIHLDIGDAVSFGGSVFGGGLLDVIRVDIAEGPRATLVVLKAVHHRDWLIEVELKLVSEVGTWSVLGAPSVGEEVRVGHLVDPDDLAEILVLAVDDASLAVFFPFFHC